jgi:hypothetical protein
MIYSSMADKIQELIRIVDATLQNVSNTGLTTGQTGMKFINFLLSVDGMKEFVGNEFYEHMTTKSLDVKDGSNQRGELKSILMYPNPKYDPWVPVNIDSEKLNVIMSDLNSIEFNLKVVDGKIYAVPSSNINLSEYVYIVLQNNIPKEFKPNVTSHVTIINSDVVAKFQDIPEFTEGFNQSFTLKFGNIKTTTSKDWSVFSDCMVIEIQSEFIKNFLIAFNDKYQTSLKPSTHITFAIVPRSLF